MLACHEEPRRDSSRILSFRAAGVNEPGTIGSVWVALELKDVARERCEELADWATKPLGKRRDRDTGPSRFAERIVGPARFSGPWWCEKTTDLGPQAALNGAKQALLPYLFALAFFPIIESKHHHGEIREVRYRSNAKTPKQLTRSELTYAVDGLSSHPSSPFSLGAFHGGNVAPFWSKRIRFTVGSTSRREFRTVNGSRSPISVDFRSGTASPPAAFRAL